MEPRQKNSKKWTKIPQELLLQIKEALEQSFQDFRDKGAFIAEGKLYASELLLRLGFLESGRLQQHNFEASLDYDFKKENLLQLIHFATDCTSSMMAEFFESKNTEFPKEWTHFTIENRSVFLKHSTVNSDLENQADALLGEANEALVGGED